MVNDSMDLCWRGLSNWASDINTDFDGDGCNDLSEDEDDDNDGVNDVNATDVAFDLCPRTPKNRMLMKMVVMQLKEIQILMV